MKKQFKINNFIPKKILVTGAAGYIGSISTYHFLKEGHEVTALDNFSSGYKEPLELLQKQFGKDKLNIFELDLNDDLSQVFNKKKIDLVVHFAASCDVSESIKNPDKYYLNNVKGTERLLNAMIKYKVKNIIFSSTCAVYGEAQYNPIDEKHLINPNNPYGVTKREGEILIERQRKNGNINYLIFRYFNVTGASENGIIGDSKKPSTLLVQNVIRSILNIEPFYITSLKTNTSDGTPIRDFINVIDLADAHLKGIEYLSSGGSSEIINLGTGIGNSILEVLTIAERITKKKIKINLPSQSRIGESVKTISSIEKAKKKLKWEPKKTVEDSMRSLIIWYKLHPNGWKY